MDTENVEYFFFFFGLLLTILIVMLISVCELRRENKKLKQRLAKVSIIVSEMALLSHQQNPPGDD